jgi:antitoxin component of MazEF toxin-antitoxin module
MYKLQLTDIGDSVAVIFPDELLKQRKLQAGDEFHVTETPEGFILTPCNPPQGAEVQAAQAG